MKKTYFLDDRENIYSFHKLRNDGRISLVNVMTGKEDCASFEELRIVDSDELIKGLVQKINVLSKENSMNSVNDSKVLIRVIS